VARREDQEHGGDLDEERRGSAAREHPLRQLRRWN
jgi:hypothetical protein